MGVGRKTRRKRVRARRVAFCLLPFPRAFFGDVGGLEEKCESKVDCLYRVAPLRGGMSEMRVRKLGLECPGQHEGG